MPIVREERREIQVRVVYHGLPFSGLTTNLSQLFQRQHTVPIRVEVSEQRLDRGVHTGVDLTGSQSLLLRGGCPPA